MVTWADRLALLCGFGLLVGGVAMMHRPTALIVAGVLLLAGVLWRGKA